MSFAQFFRKNQLLATIFLACIISLVPSSVSAQQPTGSSVPETRNPQSNSPQLFQQRNDVQPTSPQQLLNQPFRIEIPEGIPVQSGEDTGAVVQGNGRRITLLAVGIMGIGVSIILLKRSQRPQSPAQAGTALPVEKPAETVTTTVKAPPKKHKSSKKKKSKGKPRKKH